MNKHITRISLFMGILLFPTFWVIQTSEAYSFRGRTLPNYTNIKNPYSSSFSRFRLNSRTHQSARIQKGTETSSSTRSPFRSQGRYKSSIRPGDMVQRVINSPQTQLKKFTADKIPFTIRLPKEFEKKSDSLDWKTGSISFQSPDSTVTLTATGELCEGSVFQARICLNKMYQEKVAKMKTQYPNAFTLKNGTTALRSSANRTFDKKNLGKFLILKLGSTRIGNFTFFDPINEFVWHLAIQSLDNPQKILNDNRLWSQIFESLFRQEDTQTRVQRNTVEYSGRRSSVTLRSNNRAPEGYRSYTTVRAKKVPFSVAVPDGFLVTEDTLEAASGRLYIDGKKDGWISIEPTPGKCESQTSRIVRRCIEDAADVFKGALQELYPKLSIVRDQNTLLSLTTSQHIRSEVGHIVHLRGNGERVFQLTFRDPILHNLWTLRAFSPDERYAFLYDAQKLQNLINSVQFHDDE